MVWPQNASDLSYLTKDERMRGMEVIARAAKGRKPALVLGVQAEDTPAMLEYARVAEELEPDAVIAIPPTKAESLDDYREYYGELCKLAKRPVFIQTAGGSPKVEPTVELIVEMGRKFENFGYVKEEYMSVAEAVERMKAMAKHRPGAIKIILGAFRARGWTYEMRLGMDGTLTGGPMYADVYSHLWELHLAGKRAEVREVYSKLLLMTNLEEVTPGLRSYMMKRRGVFKTTVSRRGGYSFSPEAVAEIEYNFEALKPYLRV
jgi:dihydrodipicolinate synthase/N-acetylneuraminate lyase